RCYSCWHARESRWRPDAPIGTPPPFGGVTPRWRTCPRQPSRPVHDTRPPPPRTELARTPLPTCQRASAVRTCTTLSSWPTPPHLARTPSAARRAAHSGGLPAHLVQVGAAVLPVQHAARLPVPLEQLQVEVLEDHRLDVRGALRRDRVALEGDVRGGEDAR